MKNLHELPHKSPIRITLEDGTVEDAIYDHPDGMYSYCYLESDKDKVFHLSVMTPMKEVDGRWEIDSKV